MLIRQKCTCYSHKDDAGNPLRIQVYQICIRLRSGTLLRSRSIQMASRGIEDLKSLVPSSPRLLAGERQQSFNLRIHKGRTDHVLTQRGNLVIHTRFR